MYVTKYSDYTTPDNIFSVVKRFFLFLTFIIFFGILLIYYFKMSRETGL